MCLLKSILEKLFKIQTYIMSLTKLVIVSMIIMISERLRHREKQYIVMHSAFLLLLFIFHSLTEANISSSSMENPETSDIKHFFLSSPASCNATGAQESENEVIELVPLSDDEYTHNARMTPQKSVCKENRTASDQSGIKTLILFEDVDATLYEDRGFIATIHQLAETAKRPMILTSNSKTVLY